MKEKTGEGVATENEKAKEDDNKSKRTTNDNKSTQHIILIIH